MPKKKTQRALTVRQAPRKQPPPRPVITAATAAEPRPVTWLPNRFWIQGANGLWSSVERGSAAHREHFYDRFMYQATT